MSVQSEAELEINLIKQLQKLGFESITIPDSAALLVNLKSQLEKFNKIQFSDNEFQRILNHLNKGDRFRKSKALRDRFLLKRDDESEVYIRFFNIDKWCRNEYQVTNQITQIGKYENRYDVTLLINGLPLVQIELKRRGMELKEAFNQIQRYHKHSFAGTLFDFVQIFVISNGVNTKYFANNPKQTFEQTFFWTDKENNKISGLEAFAEAFLEKCTVSQFIAEYIVLAEATQIPMVLRPYQFYAVKAIEQKVKESNSNGYIWHTTGSGKTLTSYKTSQILSGMPDVKKVLFVVDRKDLDIQTTKEFNSFSRGSIDGTTNTRSLVEQLKDPNCKLIVTTIQKLDVAIGRDSYLKQIENLKSEKIVIIFDECHRSQFGRFHSRINNFFQKAQLFGFTGTPIFAENNVDGVTTFDVFGKCLHKYIITNAISDNNVLGFAIEYVGKYKKIEPDVIDQDIFTDVMVEKVDKKELLESPDRLNKIADYVLEDYKRKTKNGQFNAIFAINSVPVLKQYYTLLQAKKPKDLRIATIFTYRANEDDSYEGDDNSKSDVLDVDVFSEGKVNQHSRDFLEDCIQDYNDLFGGNFSTKDFYSYYKDIQKKIKSKEIDLVLVVNMFLTGFDSPRVNTLYVDKNLRYHGLIQAYSRTNRLLNSNKPHGNIVCFRNLKSATDKALMLYGDENAKEVVFKKPYEIQKQDFESKLGELREIAPNIAYVDDLHSEKEKADFVKTFRDLLRLKASLETFAEFTFDEVGISEQEFYDYQSKYLDIYEGRRNQESAEAVSILDEVDFELELTLRDVVNFDYIIQLIVGITDVKSEANRTKKTTEILRLLERTPNLRKKKDLIEEFILENLPLLPDTANIEAEFETFWKSAQSNSLKKLAESENIPLENMERLVSEYLYTNRLPHGQHIIDLIPADLQPSILEREPLIERVKNGLKMLVEIFEW